MASINKATLEEDRAGYQANFERAQDRQQRAQEEMLRIDGALMYIDQLIQYMDLEEQPKTKEKDKKG